MLRSARVVVGSLSLSLVLIFAACGCAPRACPPAAPAAPSASAAPATRAAAAGAPEPAAASYAPIFDQLARDVERHHVFADGRRAFWDAHKGELRREMTSATTREQALAALRHLQLALGDRHCNLRPPTDLRPSRLRLGIEVHAALVSGKPIVRVAKVKDPGLESIVSVGDVIAAVDGVPTEAYLASHPFESNALNPVAHLQETAESIVAQLTPWTTVKENDVRVLSFTRGATSFEKQLAFRRPYRYEKPDQKLDIDDGPDMAKIGCTQDEPVPYAGYALDTVGSNLCVYRATDKGARKPAIVRFLSFMYDLHGDDDAALRSIKVDHDLLARALGKDDRVVLDLHENHGGMNPFVFVSWFATKPWGHERVHVRVSDAFSDEDVRQFLWGDDDLVRQYTAARAEKKPEMSYPFLCKADKTGGSCDRTGPRRSELVTTTPVAVITGPECTSSCDAISSMWSTFGLGPVVGKQPMHGFTSVRHSMAVTAPDHRDMGRFSVALSWEGFAGHPPLEGRPIALDWEAPETFETRASWLDDAVAQATRLLAKSR